MPTIKKSPRRMLAALIAAGLILGSFPAAAASVEPVQPLEPLAAPLLIESNETGVIVELAAPVPQLTDTTADGRSCQELAAGGFTAAFEPQDAGRPLRLQRGAWIGLPPGGEPVVEVLDAEMVTLPGKYSLCPQAEAYVDPQYDGGMDGDLPELQYRRLWNAAAYAQDAFTPAAFAELAQIGYVRSQRVALLRFQPYQYNPATEELHYAARLRVRVRFASDAAALQGRRLALAAAPTDEGPFEAALRSSLLNYDTARQWRSRPQASALRISAQQLPQDTGQSPYKLLVPADGLYRLTYADLESAGIPVGTLDPRTLRLHLDGGEVAVLVSGEADGNFGAGDELRFYGRKAGTRWMEANVYWLSWGGVNGLRMTQMVPPVSGPSLPNPTGFVDTLHVEQNIYYVPNRTSGSYGDRWYWEVLGSASTPVSKSFTFNVHSPSASGEMFLRANLYGNMATPQHHTQIYLNDNLVYNDFWSVTGPLTIDVSAPQAYLLDGVNTLRMVAPMDGGITFDSSWINSFDIDYTRNLHAWEDALSFSVAAGDWDVQVEGFTTPDLEVYDITDSANPKAISGFAVEDLGEQYRLRFAHSSTGPRRFVALATDRLSAPQQIIAETVSNLRSLDNAADYILITHDDFAAQVAPLAAFRQSQGLRVQTVKVQDVYDEFSGGRVDPEAIRSFLAYAYANWQPPAPTYVLLVGDGHFDPKNYMGTNDPVFVPPYLADVDSVLKETAADNRYVSISGSDALPDMALGRLPVRTPAEAAATVAKIIAYESPEPADWKWRLLFVADNLDPAAGDFPALSDLVADEYVPSTHTVDKVYLGVNVTDPAAATQAIVTAINEGRLLVSYVGHSAMRYWAHEKLFGRDQIPSLDNAGRLTVFTPMTCLEGYYINPISPTATDLTSLAEALVRLPERGAVASFSPTGYGVATGHDYLERGLYDAIFGDHIARLGPATVQAKLFLSENSTGYTDLIETYTLFGDPATRLTLDRRHYFPLIYHRP